MMLPPRPHAYMCRKAARVVRNAPVDAKELPPFAEVELFDRRDRLNAGIGNQDVDLAKDGDGPGKAFVDLCLVGDVDRNAEGAFGPQLSGGGIRALLVVVGDDDLCPFTGEEPGKLLADPAYRTGDDGDLIF
jgi:hypothetical protein